MKLKQPYTCPECGKVWKHHDHCVSCYRLATRRVPPERDPAFTACGNGFIKKRFQTEV